MRGKAFLSKTRFPQLTPFAGSTEQPTSTLPSLKDSNTSDGVVIKPDDTNRYLSCHVRFRRSLLGTDELSVPVFYSKPVKFAALHRARPIKIVELVPKTLGQPECSSLRFPAPNSSKTETETQLELFLWSADSDPAIAIPKSHWRHTELECHITTHYSAQTFLTVILCALLALFLVYSAILVAVTTESLIASQYQSFAILISSATILLGILGIPTLRQFSLKNLVAPFLWTTRRFDVLVLAALVVSTVLSFDFTTTTTSCVFQKHLYRDRLIDYMNNHTIAEKTDVLLDAFEMFPTRPEAMILLSSKAGDLRVSDRDQFHRYMKRLADTDGALFRILNRIEEGNALESSCTTPRQTWPAELKIDPDAWILSVLPEADRIGEAEYKRDALRHLATIKNRSPLTTLMYLRLSLEIADNENTTAIILEEMRNLISAHLPDLQYSHYYQEALDAIGQWHLWRCEKDESLHQFSELMEVRRSFSATPMRWLRPPDKLGIFTLVRAARAPPSVLRTKRFTMVANYVEPLHATCGDRISVSDIKKLFESSYPDWLNADERKWYDGTVISTAHGELNTYILSILDTLWRT